MAPSVAPTRTAAPYPKRLQVGSIAPRTVPYSVVARSRLGWATKFNYNNRRAPLFLLITWLLLLLLLPHNSNCSSYHPAQSLTSLSITTTTTTTLSLRVRTGDQRRVWDPGIRRLERIGSHGGIDALHGSNDQAAVVVEYAASIVGNVPVRAYLTATVTYADAPSTTLLEDVCIYSKWYL